jgi:uridine kinase
MKPYLIGVAGPSCSGKSLLAAHLAARLNAAVLPFDAYYRPLDHLSPPQRAVYNFDAPEALDSDLLLHHVHQLHQGECVPVPVYDFATHTRLEQTIELAPQPWVIVEGLFALYWESVRALLGTKIYVDLDEELCLQRRIERDTRERGRSRHSVILQYRDTVAPMARQYVHPARAHADLLVAGNAAGHLLPGDSEFSRQLEAILGHVYRGAAATMPAGGTGSNGGAL